MARKPQPKSTPEPPATDLDRSSRYAVSPPVEPMLAKLADTPAGRDAFLYEPKWDGFRAIVFRGADEVFIQSRDLQAARSLLSRAARRRAARSCRTGCVVDGEIVIATPRRARLRRAADAAASGGVARRQAGAADAGVVRRLRRCSPSTGATCAALPQRERRTLLERTFARIAPPIHLTPDDARCARWRPNGCRASRAPGSTA